MSQSDTVPMARWTASRDADAFQELVVRHVRMVYGTALRILGNAASAEEVVQECFLELAQRPGRIRHTVGGWLHGVAVRKSLSRLRADGRRLRREQAYASQRLEACAPDWDDIRPHVDEAVAELPPELRDVILLRFFEGLKHTEIARRLDVAEATVRYRIDRALEKLRKSLARRGVSASAGVIGGLLGAHAAEASAPALLVASLGKNVLAHAASAAPVVCLGTWLAAGAVVKWAAAAVVCLVAALSIYTMAGDRAAPPSGSGQDVTRGDAREGADENAKEAVTESRTDDGRSAGAPKLAEAVSDETGDSEPQAGQGRITGRVIRADNGQPVADFRMRVQCYHGVSPHGNHDFLCWTTTDAEGRFQIDAPEATYYWFLTADDVLAPVNPEDCYIELKELGEVRDIVIKVTKGAVVTGRVFDSDTEKGLPGIKVVWAGVRLSVETDERGHYRIGGLRPGRHAIGLSDTGEYVNNAIQGSNAPLIEVECGKAYTLDFRLVKGLRPRGRVLDAAHQPIEGAWVYIEDAGARGKYSYTYVHTDAEGRFLLSSQRAGVPLTLRISPPQEPTNAYGYVYHCEEVDLAGWRNERVFILQDASSVNGRVVNVATGSPVTEFEVAHGGGDRTLDETMLNIFVPHQDDQGRFTLKNIQIGETTIFVRAEGCAAARKVVSFDRTSQTIQIEIPLEGGCVVEGVALDAAGDPVPRSGVFVDDLPAGSARSHRYAPVKADDNGRFRIDGLMAGAHVFHVVKDGFRPSSVETTLDEGETAILEFILKEGGVVAGHVTLDGQPAAGARVSAEADDRSFADTTGEDGAYRISGMIDCTTEVRASLKIGERGLVLHRTAEIADGMTTTVDFDFSSLAAVIEGTVRVNGQAPRDTAWIVGVSDGGAKFHTEVENGAYRIEDVPVGAINLHATFHGDGMHGRSFHKVVETADSMISRCDFDIDLSQSATLRGKISGFNIERSNYMVLEGRVEAGGLDELEAMLSPSGLGVAIVAAEQRIAPDGSFEFPGLLPGVYTILTVGEGADGEIQYILRTFEIGKEDVTLDMRAD